MALRRRRIPSGSIWFFGILASLASVCVYVWVISPILEEGPAPYGGATADAGATRPGAPMLTSNRPHDPVPDGNPWNDVAEKGSRDEPDMSRQNPETAERAESLFLAGTQAFDRGNMVAARANLSEAVELGLAADHLIDARATLTVIGAKTIFGSSILDGDPFVSRYVIKPGDALGKIAKKFSVTDDFLAAINGISNKNNIRVGQTLKVVQGPFHAVVTKNTFSLDVYLQTTFVKHYTVGLGADDSTPGGQWAVATKLGNPTYYPPRGGAIIAANDPNNPLGERWIGLKGIAGDALGQQRYGIHGTIDPDSIGRSVSLGCVRMHNQDVTELYTLLVPQKSRVTVR